MRAIASQTSTLSPQVVASSPCGPSRGASFPALLGIVTSLVASLLVVGCESRQSSTTAVEATTAPDKSPDQNHFEIAVDFLKMRDEHDLERSARQASYQLNRWVRDQSADPDWLVDRRLIGTLPESIRRGPAAEELLSDKALALLSFNVDDVQFLEEGRWLQATARLVAQSQPESSLSEWMQERGISGKAARALATSQAVFDWTIRNIQLEPLREYPKVSTAGPTSAPAADRTNSILPPPAQGLEGPGYTGQPWDVLMYGRGDAYQRARVFMLLLRQLRIDSAMLGIDTKIGRARPWLPAVWIDRHFYLFDTTLGLPITVDDGRGIATLSQVQQDPAILRSLDIGDKYVYPIKAEDLTSVVAMVDASPQSMSQRMKLVEKQLTAADQMVIYLSTSELAQQLKTCEAVSDVRLWAVPVEADMYARARTRILADNEEARWFEFVEHGIFQQLTPLVKGRRQFLLGQFNQRARQPGAIGLLQDARITDASMADLKNSRRLQVSMGLERPKGITDEDWNRRLEQVQRMQKEIKQHASYWIGLAQQQQQNYSVALNWLKVRTLERTPDGPWTEGARYNLARCEEALGDIDEAVRQYRIDESPQRHGNLLRAEGLEQSARETNRSTESAEQEADGNSPPANKEDPAEPDRAALSE